MNRAGLTRMVPWVLRGLGLGSILTLTAGGAAASPQPAVELHVCHAGSLQAAFNPVIKEFSRLHPTVVVKDVSGGSVALAGRMAAGTQSCDVYAAADYLDVDLLLKPMGLADYTIVFAKGRMVLAYLDTDPLTRGIAAAGEFRPPDLIPNAAADWYRILLQPGVRISGSHPFLDPSGYRSHMIFQLAQTYYNVPNLANLLMEHYTILPAVGGAPVAAALGTDYNFQFIYEHSAAAVAKGNPSYRYVAVPDRIDLSTAGNNRDYAKAAVTLPGIGAPGARSAVSIPAARVAWGLTIPKQSPNPENAMALVILLLGRSGTAALTAVGPAPITPAQVSTADYPRLPKSVQPLVKAGPVVP